MTRICPEPWKAARARGGGEAIIYDANGEVVQHIDWQEGDGANLAIAERIVSAVNATALAKA